VIGHPPERDVLVFGGVTSARGSAIKSIITKGSPSSYVSRLKNVLATPVRGPKGLRSTTPKGTFDPWGCGSARLGLGEALLLPGVGSNKIDNNDINTTIFKQQVTTISTSRQFPERALNIMKERTRLIHTKATGAVLV
jgi:hypothetical protein